MEEEFFRKISKTKVEANQIRNPREDKKNPKENKCKPEAVKQKRL